MSDQCVALSNIKIQFPDSRNLAAIKIFAMASSNALRISFIMAASIEKPGWENDCLCSSFSSSEKFLACLEFRDRKLCYRC